MVLKKQTVWLLTMLTLMVALSAYYLLSNGEDEFALSDHNPYLIESAETNQDELMKEVGIDITTTQSMTTEDVFVSLRLERDQFRAQLMEQYYNIINNSQDSNAIAEATAKMEELDLLEGNEHLVESLIKARGYADAVVYTQDKKVNVIVQKDQLNKEEAVAIINLVVKNLNVPGTNVTVNYLP